MLKSALKKSSAHCETLEKRRVSFNKTVEVYGYPSISSFYSTEQDDILQSQDDSELADVLEDVQDGKEFCNEDFSVEEPKDFFVHKVVYENYEELSPSGSLQDLRIDASESDTIVYYPYESENELQEFVVHCVNLLEERKDGKMGPVVDSPCQDGFERLGELSIENIEQHNKLTDSKMHVDVHKTSPETIGADIILSPPLQELGIDRFIGAQSDEWFWNLDISPLNSVQESDSGSNISSEDTMIMMTSAECEKNEQRIQESLQKFESLKRRKSVEDASPVTNLPPVVEPQAATAECSEDTAQSEDSSLVVSSLLNSCQISGDDVECSPSDVRISLPPDDVLDPPKSDDYPNVDRYEGIIDNLPATHNIAATFGDSLTTAEIPEDVREWRIEMKNAPFTSPHSNSSFSSLDCISYESGCDSSSDQASISLPDCTSDELESFVDQCTERIERIKKRYSISETSAWTPRRGIRPRFGSTAQILQQMQTENHLTIVSNHHYSWPCYTSGNTGESEVTVLSDSGTELSKSDIIGDFPLDRYSSSRELSPRPTNALDSAPVDASDQSCPTTSLPFHEDSPCDGLASENQTESSTPPSDSVIYYSMKV